MSRTVTRRMAAACVLMLALAARASLAADQSAGQQRQPARLKLIKANELIGMEVRDDRNHRLGVIEEAVLDLEDGAIAYLSITAVGRDEPREYILAPWSDLHSIQKGGAVLSTLPAPPGRLVRADRAEFAPMSLTHLVGMNVKDAGGEFVGQIENLMVDQAEGSVAFVILSLDASGLKDQEAPVPWQAFRINCRSTTAEVCVTAKQLKSIAYSQDNPPDLSDVAYAARIYSECDCTPEWQVFAYVPAQSAWSPESEYNKNFDPKKVKTVAGAVETIGTFRPDSVSAGGVRLRIRTEEDKLIVVHCGPAGYLRREGIRFSHGAKVTVVGATAEINGHAVMIAKEIRTDSAVLTLRDDAGTPQWTGEDARPVPAPQEEGRLVAPPPWRQREQAYEQPSPPPYEPYYSPYRTTPPPTYYRAPPYPGPPSYGHRGYGVPYPNIYDYEEEFYDQYGRPLDHRFSRTWGRRLHEIYTGPVYDRYGNRIR